MPESSKPESTLMLWLEEALPGWILPVAGIAVVLTIVLLYAAEMLSERATGVVVATAFAGGIGYAHLVPAAQNVTLRGARLIVILGSLLAAGISVYAFRQAAFPGDPVATGKLTPEQKVLVLPRPGSFRLLVSGHLAGTGEAKGDYELRISGGTEIRDSLHRSLAHRSFRRGAGVTVVQEHTQNVHTIKAAAPAQIELGRLGAEFKGELNVQVFSTLPRWLFVALIVLTVLVTTISDGLAAAKGRCALAGGAAAAFTVMLGTVTPNNLAGPTVGAVLIGVIVGALWSTIGSRLARALPPTWTDRSSKSGKDKKRDRSKT
jgi:hypothetical protein